MQDREYDLQETRWKNKNLIKTNPHQTKHFNNNIVEPSNLKTFPLESMSVIKSTRDKGILPNFSRSEDNIPVIEGYTQLSLSDVGSKMSGYMSYIAPIKGMFSISSPFQFIHDLEMLFASEISKIFTDNANFTDRGIIYDQINSFVVISTSFFIVYNWYFVQFYKDGLYRINTPEVSIDAVLKVSTIAGFLVKWNIYPVSLLNYVLLDSIPKHMSDIFSKKMSMILLFTFIVLFIQIFGASLYNSFVNALQFRLDPISGVYVIIMFICGLLNAINPTTNGGFSQLAESATQFVIGMNPMMMIIYYTYIIVLFILRFLWSSLTVCISSITVSMYLISMSFFSMMFLSSDTIGGTIKSIGWYIDRNNEDLRYIPSCDDGIVSKIFNFIDVNSRKFLSYIYKFMFELMIIISLIYGIISYRGISDADLRFGMMATNVTLVILCIIIIVTRMFSIMEHMEDEQKILERILKTANLMNDTILEDGEIKYTNKRDDFSEFYSKKPECDPCKTSKDTKTIFQMISSFFIPKERPPITKLIIGDIITEVTKKLTELNNNGLLRSLSKVSMSNDIINGSAKIDSIINGVNGINKVTKDMVTESVGNITGINKLPNKDNIIEATKKFTELNGNKLFENFSKVSGLNNITNGANTLNNIVDNTNSNLNNVVDIIKRP